MKTLSKKIISLAVLSVCILSSGQALAEGGKVSGTGSVSYTKQEALPVTEADGNLLLLGELHGTNKSSGKNDYMDGADVTNREIVQLFNGSGSHSGYAMALMGLGLFGFMARRRKAGESIK